MGAFQISLDMYTPNVILKTWIKAHKETEHGTLKHLKTLKSNPTQSKKPTLSFDQPERPSYINYNKNPELTITDKSHYQYKFTIFRTTKQIHGYTIKSPTTEIQRQLHE